MTFDAKRSIVRATSNISNRGIGVRVAAAFIGSLCVALLLSASASAAKPIYKESFACSGSTPCGSFTSWIPGRLAVNDATGDVYVIDTKNSAIEVFGSNGAYKKQILTANGEPFNFKAVSANYFDSDIAIDNSGGAGQGRIYVNDASKFVAFDASGAFSWKKGGYTEEYPCGVAVDRNGKLFSSVYGEGLQQLKADDGAAIGSPIAVISDNCHAAFDSGDDLYLQRFDHAEIFKFTAPGYTPPGTKVGSAEAYKDVEVNRTTNRAYLAREGQVQFFESDGTPVAGSPFNSALGAGTAYEYHGVAPNSKTGRLYVSNMSLSRPVVEIFDAPQFALTVNLAGSGEVKCEAGGGPAEACAASYAEGTEVTLKATASAGSTFAGFSGACVGSICTIDMSEDRTVTATFDAIEHQLTVVKAGSGSGSVTCKVGVGATGPCATAYDEGTKITLAASASAGSSFAGWSGGGCSGTGACTITLGADTSVTATFKLNPPSTCENTPSMCVSPPAPPQPSPSQTAPRRTTPPANSKKCKKGFKKKRVKGKQRCVRIKKNRKRR